MKILDKYILARFLGTYFFMIALIMSIAVVFDVSERLEKFIKNDAPFQAIIFDYYIHFIFYYANLFSSLFIFLSVLLFTSQLAQRTEIVAMLASGMSFGRMLRPYMISATILVGISIYFTHYQLPISNTIRLEFENQYIKKQFRIDDKNLHRQINDSTLAYFESFSALNNVGYKFSLEKWSPNNKLKYKLLADRAQYDSTSGVWQVDNYFERIITDSIEYVSRGRRLDTLLTLKPSDLGQRLNIATTMSFRELNKFIESERKKGSDKIVFYQIEKHQRTSYPFAAYILTIIAVSVSSRKIRGGIGAHLALGVVIAISYIFAMKVTTVAATNANLDPFIAVWIPNLVYGIIAIWLYKSAQK
jgi:lipopolysaccharide export system permease protein